MPTPKQKQQMLLKEALEVLKANGLTLATSTSEVVGKLQEESLALLKVSQAPVKAKVRYG